MQAQSYRRATAESAGASARHHAQDGRHPGEAIFCGLLAGVVVYLVSVKMACKNWRLSDVEGLAKTCLNAWKSGNVCCFHKNCFPPSG